MNKKLLIPVIIAAVALVGVGVWALGMQNRTSDTASGPNRTETAPAETTESADIGTAADAAVDAEVVIRYTDAGFEQSSYTVTKGQLVKVINESSRTLEFSSDSHPTHQLNDELNLLPMEPGEEMYFTPEKVGSWGIHDHLKASETTTLVVEE